MTKFKKIKLLQMIAVLLVVLLMSVTSSILSEKEILFPEILALLIGAWIMPKRPWQVRTGHMTVLMTLCASAGYAINRYLILPLYFKLLLGMLFVFLLLAFSASSLVPALSACILPIMTNVLSPIYPVSVFCMVFGIEIIHVWLAHRSIIKRPAASPPDLSVLLQVAVIFCVLSLYLILPVSSGQIYFAAPPLLVAFIEITDSQKRAKFSLFSFGVLFFLAGSFGTISRMIGVETLHLPMPLMLAFASGCVLLLLHFSGRLFPPVGAAALLPFLLPLAGLQWYPLKLACGAVCLYLIAVTLDLLQAAFLSKPVPPKQEPLF